MEFGSLNLQLDTDKTLENVGNFLLGLIKGISSKLEGEKEVQSPWWNFFKFSTFSKAFPQEEMKMSEMEVMNDSKVPIALFTRNGLTYLHVLKLDKTGPISIETFSEKIENLLNHANILANNIFKVLKFEKNDREEMENYFFCWFSDSIFPPKSEFPFMARVQNFNSIPNFELTPLSLCLFEIIYGTESEKLVPVTIAKIIAIFLKNQLPELYNSLSSKGNQFLIKAGFKIRFNPVTLFFKS
jgi:hypothetical protein